MTWSHILYDSRKELIPDIVRSQKWPFSRSCQIPEMTWSQILLDPRDDMIPEIAGSQILLDSKNVQIPDIACNVMKNLFPYIARPQKCPDPRYCLIQEMTCSQILSNPTELTGSQILPNPRNIISQILPDPKNNHFLNVAESQKWPDPRYGRIP